MALDAVLFDYSGVMTGPFVVPRDDARFDIDAVYGEMAAAMMNEQMHPWHELERGEITLDEFVRDIEDRVPGAGALFNVDSPSNVMGTLALRADRVALVRRVAATGRRVGLVSNNVAEWAPLWLDRLPDDLFEIIIDSSAVGMRKPDSEIYQLALDRLGIGDASTVAFVDDFEWNVAGAEAVGMRGVHCAADADLDALVGALLGTW